MLSSKKLNSLQKYIDIINANKGKTFGQILEEIHCEKHSHFKKGANGLIVENLLGLTNNSSPKADLADLKVEIKVLPLQIKTLKAKEPTQIKMINFVKVAEESWEKSEIQDKIETIFWVVYGVEKKMEKMLDKVIIFYLIGLLTFLMRVREKFSKKIGS